MRVGLIIMTLVFGIANTSAAQQWQTFFSVDSRIGYSSNTYLNPYSSEWDRTMDSGYGVFSGMGQTAWFDSDNTFEITGGAYFEPYIGSGNATAGGFGLLNYQRRFGSSLSGGLETGGSYMNSTFSRSMLWIQPSLTWFITPFTKLNVKAGPNFRIYRNYSTDGVTTDSRSRSDLYSIELETWPDFRWQLKAGLYGDLNVLPAIGEGFTSRLSAAYSFPNGATFSVQAGLQQYQNTWTTTVSGGGGGSGFPPAGGGPSQTTQTVEQYSRMYTLGVEGSVPISNRFNAFANVKGLQYSASSSSQSTMDIQISGGVRMFISPSASKRKARGISPEWQKGGDQQKVRIRYSGKGQLYLVGDFNNWNRPGVPLVKTGSNIYTAQLSMEAGSYEYKVLLVENGEEKWIEFSDDIYTVDDGFGGENALLLVE